jgi:diamine N-acetyltransferase
MLTLREVTDENRAAICGVRISRSQQEYASGIAESLEEARTSPEAEPWYRAVRLDETPIGFVMLGLNVPPADERYPWSHFLWRLLIDERFQRRGYGTKTLDVIVQWLATQPGADALFTSVTPGDESPAGFYERYGFVRTGQIFDEEMVLRLDLAQRQPLENGR